MFAVRDREPQLDGYDLHDGLARSSLRNRGIVSLG